MNALATSCLLLTLPILCFSQLRRLDRQERDIIHDLDCEYYERTVANNTVCTCKSQYSTWMSVDEGYRPNCHTPLEVGCRYSLRVKGKTFLITEPNTVEELIPTGSARNITGIGKIYIWNYRTERIREHEYTNGHWDEIYTGLFSLNHKHTFLLINYLDLKKWGGQAVKIEFSNGECVIVKVRGKINYPVHVDSFKRALKVV